MRGQRGRNINVALEARRARRNARLLRGAFALFGVSALVITVYSWYRDRVQIDDVEHRILVAPFENLTGNAALDYVGVAAADWTNQLLALRWRKEVVPVTTALAYSHSAGLARYDPLRRYRALASGTRAGTLITGAYYLDGPRLRFYVELYNLAREWTIDTAHVAVDLQYPMDGVQRVQAVVSRKLGGPRLVGMPAPDSAIYRALASGFQHYVKREYARAAQAFASAPAVESTAHLPPAPVRRAWLLDALIRARQFPRADSVAAGVPAWLFAPSARQMPLPLRADHAILMRGVMWLRNDLLNAHRWSTQLMTLSPADDLVQFDHALSALALNRSRQARRLFKQMHPHRGALHGRPEYWLHYAAAYHHLGEHSSELRIIREGQLARPRAVDVRLAYCRVRAALGDREDALSALNAISYADTDTTRGSVSIGTALEDCAAELGAHGLPDLARQGLNMARVWRRNDPVHQIVRDSAFEPGYILLEEAGRQAEAGQIDEANSTLQEALEQGLPYYEPGRVLLHAEPALRKLRNTRGFLRINQPQG
ncbi:MAG TPA: hypothetical protein VGD27_00545 [Longimicrobiales bacterium]